jgi:protein-L-isoaspartate(D-aspartate) O-methyltransferase
MPEHQQNWADIAGTDAASIAGAETAAFLMSLRAKGIRDTALLRVMEGVPRSLFAPARCADLAPSVVATLLAALACKPGQRVLEIGTGSGYITALLAQLAAEVVSVERYRGLAVAAAERLGALGATNVTVIHRDGLALSRELGGFDRILLTGSVTALPEGLFSALQPAGVLVAVVPVNGLPRVVVVSRTQTGAFQETHGAVMRLPPLAPGIGGVL